jgi:hypothetical protein
MPSTQVLVDIRPVDAAAGSGKLPPTALFRRGIVQSRIPPQWVTIFRPS